MPRDAMNERINTVVSIFDDETEQFVVLSNDRDEQSIWPMLLPAPAGWHVVSDPGTRDCCLSYVDNTWTVTATSHRGAEGDR
jgi:MbtH protein